MDIFKGELNYFKNTCPQSPQSLKKIRNKTVVGSDNFGPCACHPASEKFLSIAVAIHGGFHCSSMAWEIWGRIRLLSNS